VNRKKSALTPHPKYPVSKVELSYISKCKASERPTVASSRDAYDILLDCWDDNKLDLCEDFKVIYLNRANKVLSVCELSRGGLTGTVADPRHIIIAALEQNACSMILAHNHPSGSLKPSAADERLTTKTSGAASFLDQKVLDHLIISRDGYFSFADEGLNI
jgi:DNA repair protein RadC